MKNHLVSNLAIVSRSVFCLLTFFSFSYDASANYTLNCKTVPDLFRAYLTQHIHHRSLTPELHARTMEQYVKLTDPTKMLLLEEDVKTIKTHVQKLFLGIRKGDCSALDKIQALVLKRAQENEQIVKKLMADENIKIDESIKLVLNPDKREYAKNQKEKAEMIRKSAHFQLWNYLNSETDKAEARKKLHHRYELTVKRIQERDNEDLLVSFIDAFTQSLDPHTSYLSREREEDFRIDMSLSLDGIGAQLSSRDGFTIVEEIIPGGAADRAEVLMRKDKIIAVGQDKKGPVQSVTDMELKDVVRLIRGKRGTTVRLTLLRKEGEETKRLNVSIVRDKIDLKDAAAKITYHERKLENGKTVNLGLIDLPSFYGASGKDSRSGYEDVKALIAEANKKEVDGIVLNLSRNGGGLLDDAIKISGLFIKEGAIVATVNARKNIDIKRDRDPTIQFRKPLVVLTSRGSASASEILAGALRDYNRALIVGADNTFGKGSVQAVLSLAPSLGAMKVTTGMFFVPGGQSTQNLGVAGQIELPSPLSNDELGEKNLDNALPPMKINSFLSQNINSEDAEKAWKPINEKIVEELAKKSKARVDSSEDFKEIRENIAEAEKNDGIVHLAEMMKKDKEEKAEEDKKEGKKEEDKTFKERVADMQRPYLEESLNILADLVAVQYPDAGAIIVGEKAPEVESKKN